MTGDVVDVELEAVPYQSGKSWDSARFACRGEPRRGHSRMRRASEVRVAHMTKLSFYKQTPHAINHIAEAYVCASDSRKDTTNPHYHWIGVAK